MLEPVVVLGVFTTDSTVDLVADVDESGSGLQWLAAPGAQVPVPFEQALP